MSEGGRVETGPVRFGDDWAGVFIRGDDAGSLAFDLAHIMGMASGDGRIEDALALAHVGNLVELLRSCQEPCEARQLPAPEPTP